MEDLYLKKIMTAVILAGLLILSFLLVRPVLMAVIVGLILAFIFARPYDWIKDKIKSPNLSAFIVCLFLVALIIIPLWLFTPIVLEQAFTMYQSSQQMDFATPLKTIFPSLFASAEFSAEVGNMIHSFVTSAANKAVNLISSFILNFMTFFLQAIVAFFVLFFVLKEKKRVISYVKSLSPFSREVEEKLFEYSKGITASVIYGQIIVGLIQGLVVGIGFFIFGIPNALLLTVLASLAGVFPIIGTTIVWLPVVIYLLIAGNSFPAFGIVVFGLLSSILDNFIRPMIVSKRTQIHSAIILVGMIGGLFFFGIMGFVLGPLILSYLIVLLELYRRKKSPGIFIKVPTEKPN